MPTKTIPVPLVAFEIERMILGKLAGANLPTGAVIKNPMFDELMGIRKNLDEKGPGLIEGYLTLKSLAAKFAKEKDVVGAAVRIDAEDIKVKVRVSVIGAGLLTELYKKRAEDQLSKQADEVADIIRRQVLPSVYVAEKEKGFLKANEKKLEWKKDGDAAKLFDEVANVILKKQLKISQTETVDIPFRQPVRIIFNFESQIKIKIGVSYAELKK